MTSKIRLLRRSRLYVIIDTDLLDGKAAIRIARAALRGGCNVLQLRDKRSEFNKCVDVARKLKIEAGRYAVPVIVNDRADVAIAAGCDGLHIGQGDIDIALAKRLLSPDSIIGVSATTIAQAKKAASDGADYVGIGPMFKTPIKDHKRPIRADVLRKTLSLGIPVFAIGGIDRKNIAALRELGCYRIAVIRAVCNARDPYKATQALRKLLQ